MRVIVYEYTGEPVRPWYNWNSPLQMQHHDLSREKLLAMEEDFPLIADFEIVLITRKGSPHRYEVLFFSEEKGGNVAFTLFYDQRLRQKEFTLPLDFDDLDQGWHISILAEGVFVYIWESDFDRPEKGILRWFKVPRERYIREWQQAIEMSLKWG
jgi:hypothetical protein